ncbi:MAG: fibronectin type III domain-containing protein [Oscillospiraceae bacterium]|nr:fibronectin type III domain-containing protein [Oscillospiraceae bacterium]
MKKLKLCATVLSAAMIFAAGTVSAEKPLLTITASAEEDANGFVIETDADGDRYVSGYNGSGGDITIPSDVVWIGKKAFSGNTSITSVTIPKTCWYWVDNNAFSYCSNLKSVKFEGDIDGMGGYAFYGCTSLETVTFGGNVGREDGDGGIGSYAFGGCPYLKTVKFSDKNAKLDLVGEYAFINCIRLTSINMPADTGTLYTGAFLNCASLSNITIPGPTVFDGEYIMGYMYGRETADGKLMHVKADGTAALYPAKLAGLEKADKKIAQKELSMTLTIGSYAERYAANNSISYSYTAESLPQKLSAPQNVTGEADANQIVLTWDKVEGAVGYRVYMYDPVTGKYKSYKSVKSTKCTVTELKSGTEYSFRVTALDVSGGKYVPGKASTAVSVTTK